MDVLMLAPDFYQIGGVCAYISEIAYNLQWEIM
jgi:hypothetical protein